MVNLNRTVFYNQSNVYYLSNIQNKLISTYFILKNGCAIIMKSINNKDRIQIFKNNNLISNIIANDENLFIFDIVSTNNVVSKNFVYNI